ALAAALFAPHVVWEAANGWPSAEFIANAAATKNAPVTFLSFLGGQIVLLHPLALPLWLAGLVALLVAAWLARVRALGLGYLATFALLLIQRGKVYYLAPYYPVLFAAGALALERLAARPRLGWTLPAATVLYAAAGIAVLPLALPVLPVETFLAYSQAIGIEEPRTERSPRGALPQLYADMHGWPEMVDTVARVAGQLPADQRARAVVLVRNYGEAGAIEFLGRPRGLPRAIAGHNNFWLWGPGDLRADDTVIAVGLTREQLLTAFSAVERVDTTHCQWCMPYENDLPVHIARGLTAPLDDVWARLKRFM
ncbi:MAG: glycosyltransferase family 39 protein, partial [Candidatus Binatia bacterium]